MLSAAYHCLTEYQVMNYLFALHLDKQKVYNQDDLHSPSFCISTSLRFTYVIGINVSVIFAFQLPRRRPDPNFRLLNLGVWVG